MSAIHWTIDSNGAFTTAADWSGGVVPGSSDDAILDPAGSAAFTVTTSGSITVNSIQTAATATLAITGAGYAFTATDGTGSGVNFGSIEVGATSTFTVGGAIANSGAIGLNSSGHGSGLLIVGSATLSGGGTLTMTDFRGNAISGSASLINVDNTIAGAGAIGTGFLALTNEALGVIDATGVSNALVVDTTSFANAGLVETTGSAGMTIENPNFANTGTVAALGSGVLTLMDVSIANIGGVVSVAAGGHISLQQGASIAGGTLIVAAGAVLSADSGADTVSADAFNNSGSVIVSDGTGLELTGSVANSGSILVNSFFLGASLQVAGATTLSGDGSVFLGDFHRNHIVEYGAASLTNLDNTIVGSGTIGAGSLTLVNGAAGVIDASGSVSGLIINVAYGSSNAGLIEATGSVGLTIENTSITNTGTVAALGSGVLTVSNATISGGTFLTAAGSQIILGSATIGASGAFTVVAGAVLTSEGGGDAITATTFANQGVLVDTQGSLSIQGAVVNSGSVIVGDGTDLELTGSVANSGSIFVNGVSFGDSLQIAGATTLSGGGSMFLSDFHRNHIVEYGAASLTNLDNTIVGSGTIGAGSLTLVNGAAGVIDASGSVSGLIINVAYGSSNAGLIEATGSVGMTIENGLNNTGILAALGGMLTLNAAVTGNGSAVINNGTLDAAAAFSENVDFTGTAGELELAQSQGFSAAISGFAAGGGESLDLGDIGFVGAGEASFTDNGHGTGGVLTITDGIHAAHITLVGDYVGDSFVASSDGQGGTSVVAAASSQPPFHWANAVDGYFATGSDWTGGVEPGPSDNAILDPAGSAFTVASSASVTVNSIQTAANATLLISASAFTASNGTGTGANAGEIVIGNGADFVVDGTLINSGSILADGGSLTNGSAADTTALIEGNINGVGTIYGAYGSGPKAGAITNFGTIIGEYNNGIDSHHTQSVTNGSAIDTTALIQGGNVGVYTGRNGGAVTNFGTILARNAAVVIVNQSYPSYHGQPGDGVVTNGSAADTSALLEGGEGVYIGSNQGGGVTNYGTILGRNGDGVRIFNFGGPFSLTNGSAADAAAVMSGSEDGVELSRGSAPATLTNFGTISGAAGTAVLFDSAVDELVVEAGSTFLGTVHGGAGTLILDNEAGAGTLTGLGVQFVNFGQVEVATGGVWTLAGSNTLSSGQTLTDDGSLTDTGSFANAGRVEVTSAGDLTVLNATVTNSDTVVADPSAHIVLDRGTISGGAVTLAAGATLSTAAGDIHAASFSTVTAATLANQGVVEVAYGSYLTLQGPITNTGSIIVDSGATVDLGGPVVNTGSILIDGTGTFTNLYLTTNLTLSGGGQVNLVDTGGQTFVFATAPSVLTNVDNTISGAGDFDAALTLINQASGVIDATDSARAMFFFASVTLANAGLIETTGAAGMIIQSQTFTNNGTLGAFGSGALTLQNVAIGSTGGQLNVASGGVASLQSSTITGGAVAVMSGGRLSADSGADVINASLTNAGQVTVGSGVTLTTEAGVTTSGSITVEAGGTFQFTGNGYSIFAYNTGVITVQAGGSFSADNGSIFNSPDRSAQGDGQIVADSGAEISLQNISINGGGVTVDSGATLTAADSGGGIATFTNQGSVEVVAGQYFDLNGGFDNSGVMRVEQGSRLTIIDLNTAGPGGAAGPMANSGAIEISDQGRLNLRGTFDNSGSIVLGGATGATYLDIGWQQSPAGNVTLDGGGRILLSDSAFNRIDVGSAPATLTNVDNTISGAGVFAGALTLVNQAAGVIDASGTHALIIQTSGAVTNAGLIEASGIGGMIIDSSVTNTGTLAALSATLTLNAAVTGGGSAVINGGTLDAASAFSENVDFTGTAGELELAQSQGFSAAISGFAAGGGESLDLGDVGFVNAGEANFTDNGHSTGGVLTISDGTHTAHITLVGDYVGDSFVASSDGHGGTTVVAALPPPFHWANAVSGDFATGSNWTGGAAPGSSNNAILDASGPAYTVTSSSSVTVNSIQTAANATLLISGSSFTATNGTGTGANAGEIVVSDGWNFTTGGTLLNTGAILINGGPNYGTVLYLESGGTTLSGGGKVTLSDWRYNYIAAAPSSGSSSLVNVDNTISGAGRLGQGLLSLTNQVLGVIDATGTGINYLFLQAPTANAGLIETTGAAGMVIQNTLTNTGTVAALGSGALTLQSASIGNTGGRVTVAAGGRISLQNGAISGGIVNVAAGGIVSADSGGVLAVDTVNNAGTLQAVGSAELTLTIGPNLANVVVNNAGGEILANGGTVNLAGANIFGGTIAALSGGVIDAHAVLDGVASTLTIQGGIVVTDRSDLTLRGVINNTGVINVEGATGSTSFQIGTGQSGSENATLTGGGQVVLSDSGDNEVYGGVSSAVLDNVNDTFSGAGQFGIGQIVLINEAAGVIDATGTNALIIQTNGSVTNAGLMEAAGKGGMTIQSAVNNTGTLAALGAGALQVTSGAAITNGATGELLVGAGGRMSLQNATLTNLSGTTLTGGDYEVDAGGTLELTANTTVKTLAATVELNGGGSNIQSFNSVTSKEVSFESSLITIAASGVLKIVGGRNYTTTNSIANTGTLQLGGGTLNAAHLTDAAGAALSGFGTVAAAVSGAGAVSASGGTLAFTGAGDSFTGTLGGSGTIAFTGGSDSLTGATLKAASMAVNGGSVTLSGAIALSTTLSVSTPTLIIAAAGATLSGGGTVALTSLTTAAILGASATATLTNATDTLSGAGQLGEGSLTLVNNAGGFINGNQSAALIVNTGSKVITNAGVIESTASGGVTVDSAVKNTGTLAVTAGTLSVQGAVSGAGVVQIGGGVADFISPLAETVTFTGSAGVLELAKSKNFGGTITGFSKTGGTSLDLDDISFKSGVTQATFKGTTASGTLTVTDGKNTAKITLIGNYTGSTFTVSSDGHGGTTVVDPTSPPPPTAALVQASAGFGAPSGGSSAAFPELRPQIPTMLAGVH